MEELKWGILAPGRIAGKFSGALDIVNGAVKYCVASRSESRAKQFAQEHNFEKHYGSYQAMVDDPGLDVIYIASPHSHHLEHTLMALRGGKHVLCEKAFSINTDEVKEMTDLAKEKNLFLMEALWPPFQPSYRKADEVLASSVFGEILHIRSKFSFHSPYDPEARTYNPLLAGGALLDIGIYPLMDALRYLGVPDDLDATATFAPTGVDSSVTATLKYKGGTTAELHGSFLCNDGIATEIILEKGRIILTRGRDRMQSVEFGAYGMKPESYSWRCAGNGFEYEIQEVMTCISEGRYESRVVPHQFSLDLMNTLDGIRVKAGIVYEGR